MKKVLAMVAVFVMMPLAAFAKTAISDSDLGAVTGQAGVSINLDVTIPTLTIGVVALGDSDGNATDPFGGVTTAGYVGLKNVAASNIHIGLDPTVIGTLNAKLLSIDIATAAAASLYSDAFSGVALGSATGTATPSYVHIGLPTAYVDVASLDASVQIGSTNTLGTELVSLHVANVHLTIGSGSFIDVLAH